MRLRTANNRRRKKQFYVRGFYCRFFAPARKSKDFINFDPLPRLPPIISIVAERGRKMGYTDK